MADANHTLSSDAPKFPLAPGAQTAAEIFSPYNGPLSLDDVGLGDIPTAEQRAWCRAHGVEPGTEQACDDELDEQLFDEWLQVQLARAAVAKATGSAA